MNKFGIWNFREKVCTSSSIVNRISGYHLITMQNSEPHYHSMYIGMEHELSNKCHLLPAGSHNTAVPYLTLETRC